MAETSQKQIEANQQNAKLGGVKTEEGKEVSKYNAVKHVILKEIVSDYEQDFYGDIEERLNEHFSPVGTLEEMLVDRIGICYLRLYRVAKAENEFMKSKLNPRRITFKNEFPPEYTVENEGYLPRICDYEIEKLSDVYLRYEIRAENRLYKAVSELERLQAKRNGFVWQNNS